MWSVFSLPTDLANFILGGELKKESRAGEEG